MMLTPNERAEIYRAVRVVLVRHFIDIGRLAIQISPGRINLRGNLVRLPGVETKLTSETVTAIFAELERIRDIRRVEGDFENWRQGGFAGAWVPIGEEQKDAARTARGETTSQTFTIHVRPQSPPPA
jgi:hypothetical protein